MSVQLNSLRNRYDSITVSTIQVATVLSLLLHALLLWSWHLKPPMLPLDQASPGVPEGRLAVRLTPPAPPPLPASSPQPMLRAPSPGAAVHRPPPAPPPAPRRLAVESPSPSATPQPPETAQPPAPTDFAAFVESRRRAREPAPASAPSQPVESEQARDNRLAAERLGLDRLPTFGEPDRGGGIFDVARVGIDDAEFFFYGWSKDIRRVSKQMIPVRRGSNPTIELAVVRRMIALIRELTKDDFRWNSRRLGRTVNLSARMDDNAGLEDFLMQEFFSSPRSPGRPR
jgi:hypothetical protein